MTAIMAMIVELSYKLVSAPVWAARRDGGLYRLVRKSGGGPNGNWVVF